MLSIKSVSARGQRHHARKASCPFDSHAPLTSEKIGIVSVDIDEPTANSDKWEMAIDHPHVYLRFKIHGPQIVHDFLAFLRGNLNKSEYSELRLGALGSAAVSIIKDDEFPNRFFLCVLSDDGAVRYTLNVNELGDYIGGVMRAADGLSKKPPQSGEREPPMTRVLKS